MLIDLSECTYSVKIFVSHVNVHLKEILVELDFDNHMDSMTSFVDTAQSSSPDSPVIP